MLTEDEQAKLYWTLLRGPGKECQDRLCRFDQNDFDHNWGPAIATDHYPDLPPSSVMWSLYTKEPPANDTRVVRSYSQTCLNCGKIKTW